MTEPPTEADLRAALDRITVSGVLTETMQGLASLGYHRLSAESRDLDQVRLAIEALRALNGTLEGTAPPELTRDFGQVIANLQLAYASAAVEGQAEESEGPPTEEPQPEEGDDAG
jgi:hypothetical protein